MSKDEFLEKYGLIEITEEDGFKLDIVYATENNFTGCVLYNEPICLIRKGTYEKLVKVNEELKTKGFKLKLWDVFRFHKCQEKMWNIVPDERFVANPYGGKCSHCKGSSVDVTLVTLDDKDVQMPTEFDHFGDESYRNSYDKLEENVKNNVLLLENTMIKYGFVPYEFEWWHFEDSDKYDVIYDSYE